MLRLLVIAQESKIHDRLYTSLAWNGFAFSITSYDAAEETIVSHSPDLVLLEMTGKQPDSETGGLLRRLKQARLMPVIALVSKEMLDNIDDHLDVDDFLASPYDARELILRVKRLLHRNGNKDSSRLIKCDGLVIDLAGCEVALEGRVIELTFKEYELLKLLASNRGRVYTREALLNRVWGHDYYGGDRTVDVHVRRLRSKIEDSKHNFIETVRNIGYRFRREV